MVNKWTEELTTEEKVKNKTIYHVVEAFRAAVSFIAEEGNKVAVGLKIYMQNKTG